MGWWRWRLRGRRIGYFFFVFFGCFGGGLGGGGGWGGVYGRGGWICKRVWGWWGWKNWKGKKREKKGYLNRGWCCWGGGGWSWGWWLLGQVVERGVVEKGGYWGACLGWEGWGEGFPKIERFLLQKRRGLEALKKKRKKKEGWGHQRP